MKKKVESINLTKSSLRIVIFKGTINYSFNGTYCRA